MTLVGSFAVSHAPGMVAWPDRAPVQVRKRLLDAYATAGERLRRQQPDVVVLVTGEHFANFFSVIPSFCIHIGEYTEGPIEPWLGIDRHRIPTNATLADEILCKSLESGRDLAFSHELVLDHGSIVPLELMAIPTELPIVPLIVNTLVHPLPTLASCRRLGTVLGSVVAESDLRVALVAAGGLSHWPGMAEAGMMSPDWDRAVLEGLATGHRDVLWSPPSKGLEQAGPGAEEIRSWTVVGSATPNARADVLAYAPVEAWVTGCAVVDLLGSVATAGVGMFEPVG